MPYRHDDFGRDLFFESHSKDLPLLVHAQENGQRHGVLSSSPGLDVFQHTIAIILFQYSAHFFMAP